MAQMAADPAVARMTGAQKLAHKKMLLGDARSRELAGAAKEQVVSNLVR
jgi:hypothetical protein